MQRTIILQDTFRNHYRLHTPNDELVRLAIKPKDFRDTVYAEQFVRSLRVHINFWSVLLGQYGHYGISGYAVSVSLEAQVSQLLKRKIFKIYPIKHLDTGLCTASLIHYSSSQTEKEQVFQLVPYSVALVKPRANRMRFANTDEAVSFLSGLDMSDAQRNELANAMGLPVLSDGEKNPADKIKAMAKRVIAEKWVVLIHRQSITPRSSDSAEDLPHQGAEHKPASLGPHEVRRVCGESLGPAYNLRSSIMQQADTDVDNATVHDFSKDDDGKMKQVYRDYNTDPAKIGGTAKELGPKLITMNEIEFEQFLDRDVKAGKCTMTPEHGVPSPMGGRQTMLKYEYPDGTMVRYKPEGDYKRVGIPTYSIEVKKNPDRPDPGGMDAVHTDVAFKVDEKGRLVPRHPDYIIRPYPAETPNDKLYVDTIMDMGHKALA